SSFGTSTSRAGDLKVPPELISSDQSIAQATIQYPKLPPNFNPLSASAADLASNGLPPKPDPHRAPDAFRHSKQLALLPRKTKGKVTQTKIYHSPPKLASQHATVLNDTTTPTISATATNWSGYAILPAPGTFTVNGSAVFSEWVVPIAQQAPFVCDPID